MQILFFNSTRKRKIQTTLFYYNIQVFCTEIDESQMIYTVNPNPRFFHILRESLDEQVCIYAYVK